jgi:hypothetical protein
VIRVILATIREGDQKSLLTSWFVVVSPIPRTHFTAVWRVRSLRAGNGSCLFPGIGNRSIVTLDRIGTKLTQGISTENLPA